MRPRYPTGPSRPASRRIAASSGPLKVAVGSLTGDISVTESVIHSP